MASRAVPRSVPKPRAAYRPPKEQFESLRRKAYWASAVLLGIVGLIALGEWLLA